MTCVCGRQTRKFPRCLQCRVRTCRCGGRKAWNSQLCSSCRRQERRGPHQQCEFCGVSFWRYNMGDPAKDARRFCSRRCSALHRGATGRQTMQNPEIRARIVGSIAYRQCVEQRHAQAQERQRQREQEWQELQKRLQEQRERYQEETKCACGAPSTIARWTPTHPYMRRWCEACHTQEFQAWQHVCPNCGQEFDGEYRTVYCSERCATQMRKRQQRSDTYPSIGGIPLAERNKLAELIALMRAANRQAYKER
jgi:predicted nucleic acid-binding Zn ribbon protein